MNVKDVKQLSDLYGVNSECIESLINISLEHQPEKLRKIMAIAVDYFNTEDGARSWFVSVNKGLGTVTPLSLLNTDKGLVRVKTTIIKLKYGMTA
jgi:uncharacterized protein (DUF2384 family)